MKKEWKAVVGYEGRYSVSNYGDVWSHLTNKQLRPGRSGTYLSVSLSDGHGNVRSYHVHVLVAKAFIPNPHKKRTVNHKTRPNTNNRVTNLEWATYSENHAHAYAFLGRKAHQRFGKANSKSRPIKNSAGERFECARDAAKKHNVSPSAIGKAAKNGTRSANLLWWFE